MDTRNILLCGLGGQGILFMTKILAQTALNKGFDIMGAETHGMAQRGWSVVSHLRLGQAGSSLVRTGSAHILLALEENEGYRNLPFLSNGAIMFVNAGINDFPIETVKAFLEKKQVTCHTIPASELADDLGVFEMDPTGIHPCLLNLVTNAIDAMDEKAETPENKGMAKRLEIRSSFQNGNVVVEVTDNGIGMSQEVQDKLFEPFFTTKKIGKGTGLGVSISYGIIKDYSGSIEIDSLPAEKVQSVKAAGREGLWLEINCPDGSCLDADGRITLPGQKSRDKGIFLDFFIANRRVE
mgnify:CR=1 FL=1